MSRRAVLQTLVVNVVLTDVASRSSIFKKRLRKKINRFHNVLKYRVYFVHSENVDRLARSLLKLGKRFTRHGYAVYVEAVSMELAGMA
jgi:hypothetical protein